MDLWILNQDKTELLKCDGLNIMQRENDYIIQNNSTSLGVYPSKERSMEIFTEILFELNNRTKNNIVYTLPLK